MEWEIFGQDRERRWRSADGRSNGPIDDLRGLGMSK